MLSGRVSSDLLPHPEARVPGRRTLWGVVRVRGETGLGRRVLIHAAVIVNSRFWVNREGSPGRAVLGFVTGRHPLLRV